MMIEIPTWVFVLWLHFVCGQSTYFLIRRYVPEAPAQTAFWAAAIWPITILTLGFVALFDWIEER